MMFKSKILFFAITITFSLAQEEELEENVKILNWSKKGLTSLTEHNFSQYHDLEELDLSNNDIHSIKEDIFIDNYKLKKLNLSGNANLKLPEFSTLLNANIKEIDLSHCNIEVLPTNIFDGMRDLKVIDLSGNPLIEEESINESALINLMSPKKLILPYVDEALIKKICNEVDITIGIKSDDYTDSILCAAVRDGTWEYIPKETDHNLNVEPDVVNTEAILEEETHTDPPQLDNYDHAHPDDPIEEQVTERDTDKDLHTEETNVLTTEIDKNNTQNTVSSQIINNEEESETKKDDIVDVSTVPPHEHNEEEKNENVNVHSDLLSTESNVIAKENIPVDVVDSALPNTPQENVKDQENEDAPPAMQRGVIKPLQTENIASGEPQSTENQLQKMGNIQDQAKENKAVESSGTGSTVLVVLVIVVVIAGAAAFGYKFYKSRKYEAARTAEPVGRELKEIVVDKKTNGTTAKKDVIEEKEEEPLMERQTNSVEIKEIDETNENDVPNTHKTATTENIKNSPITSNPYVPTTTSIKPPNPSPNKPDDKTQK